MKVYFVGAGPGSADLLTLKAHRLISGAKVCVYAGSLVSPQVMALVPSGAELYDSSRMSLPEIIEVCRSSRSRGLDVVRAFRQRHPACRTAAVTGLDQVPTERLFLESGADTFLAKPVDLHELLAAVGATG